MAYPTYGNAALSPNENTFDSTTLRSPRYSGRRALNFVNNLSSPIENFVAPPVETVIEPPVVVPPVVTKPIGDPGGGDPGGVGPGSGDDVGSNDNSGVPGGQNTGESVSGFSLGDDNPGNTGEAVSGGQNTGEAVSGFAIGSDSDAVGGVADGTGNSDAAADAGVAGGAVGGDAVGGDAAGDAGAAAGGDGSGDGGCFITEAVMAAGGQNDRAPELEAMRQLRDVMMTTPSGQAIVAQYYAIAPIVVEAVSQRPDAMQIFGAIKAKYIDPAAMAVQAGDMNAAFQAYAEMMAFVTPFAVEADLGAGGDPDDRVQPGQEPIDDFGDTAAMGAYNPEMSDAATGGAEMEDPMAGAGGYSGGQQGGLPPQPAGMPGYPGGPTSGRPMTPEPAIGQFVRRY